MINLEEKKTFLEIARGLRSKRGLEVEYRIEFDEITLTAYLVYYIKGILSDASGIVGFIEKHLSETLGNISMYTTRSKGRGRPRKDGAPAAEGLIVRCVLPNE